MHQRARRDQVVRTIDEIDPGIRRQHLRRQLAPLGQRARPAIAFPRDDLDPGARNPFGKGVKPGLGGFDADESLTGSLADVALFSGLLTGGAIDSISNGVVNPSSAVIFLRWNDDTGTFEDISPRNNDLTTNGNVVTDTGPVATVTEDGSIVISGIEVSDPDNTSTTVTLSVGNGEISFTGGTTNLTFADGDGTDGTLTFSGSITAINAALANSIQYSPDADFDGTDTLTVTADDGSGAGPALKPYDPGHSGQ